MAKDDESSSNKNEESSPEKKKSKDGDSPSSPQKKKGNDGAIDIMSPFFLHVSDQPGQLFVSELLNDGNYGEWVADMSNTLYAKNKIGFVDGTIPMLEVDSSNLAHWMHCNAMVKGWLKNAMDKEIRGSVRYAVTAREIWKELEERFAKGSAPRIYELRRAITHLRQDKQSISTYYTKLKGLWDEIQSISPWPECKCSGCKCDAQKQFVQMREREHLYDFLMGLDEVFNTVNVGTKNKIKKLIFGTNAIQAKTLKVLKITK